MALMAIKMLLTCAPKTYDRHGREVGKWNTNRTAGSLKIAVESQGEKIADLGIGPPAVDDTVRGLNGGKNGGRIC